MKRSGSLQLALAFLRHNKLSFVIAVVFRSLWELVPMQVPLFAGLVVDGLTGKPTSIYGIGVSGADPVYVLHFAAVGLAVVAVLYGVTAYVYTITGAELGLRFVLDLRKRVNEKITRLSLERQDEYGAGELLDRTLNDTSRLQQFLDQVFIRTSTNVIRIGYPVVMLFVLEPTLALLALSVVPFQWLILWGLQKKLYSVTQAALTCQSELTHCVKEGLDGAETIQTLRAEPTRLAETSQRIESVESLQRKGKQLTALIRSTVWLMTGVGIALIWWRGGLLVYAGAMSLGTLIVFTGFAEFAYRPFRFFPRIVEYYEKGRASLGRIQELLQTPSTVIDCPEAPRLEVRDGQIEFRDVSFAYHTEPVLQNIDLTLESRQFTAIVGRSGSGKSSLLRLVARLYDPRSGRVCIDGQSIEACTLASVREHVAVVPQSPMLFSATVGENLLLANPDACPDALRNACERAGASEFLDQFPTGMDTCVGRGGMRLSGGQAQRLAIARALLQNPSILLLDEPTSALDSRSQELIIETLLRLRRRMNVVLVGHRVETFRHADQIVVMHEGRIVDMGTHEALLLTSTEYADLLCAGEKESVQPNG